MLVEKTIRNWRVGCAEPHGVTVWFDPRDEFMRLFHLPPAPDGEEAQGTPERVVEQVDAGYLDMVGSVSAAGQRAAHGAQKFQQLSFLREEDELPF